MPEYAYTFPSFQSDETPTKSAFDEDEWWLAQEYMMIAFSGGFTYEVARRLDELMSHRLVALGLPIPDYREWEQASSNSYVKSAGIPLPDFIAWRLNWDRYVTARDA